MTGKWHGGKGSAQRKRQVSYDTYSDNWDAIFNKPVESDSEGIKCPHCGEWNTHDECGSYEVLFPECKKCGECTEI